MHGRLIESLEGHVTAVHGGAVWRTICARAGAPEDGLLTPGTDLQPCAYALVHAGADALGISRRTLLEACGAFWLEHQLAAWTAADRAACSPLPVDAPAVGRLQTVYALAQNVLRQFGADNCMLLPTGHDAIEVQLPGAGALVREWTVGVFKALSQAAGVAAAVREVASDEARGFALHRVEVQAC